MYEILLSFITAFIPSYFIIPSVINVAKIKHLYDEPGERSSHTEVTPSLGGVAIFAGVVFSVIFWTPFAIFGELQYTLGAFIIIFLFGVKDDIMPMTAYKKLLGLGLYDSFRLHHDEAGHFSGWDFRSGGFRRNNGLRIDLILISDALKSKCIASEIDREPRTWERPSDHTPVMVELADP